MFPIVRAQQRAQGGEEDGEQSRRKRRAESNLHSTDLWHLPGGATGEQCFEIVKDLRARATLGYREKKMSLGVGILKGQMVGKVCQSSVTAYIHLYTHNPGSIILFNDYITRSLSRWHSFGSISNASTT